MSSVSDSSDWSISSIDVDAWCEEHGISYPESLSDEQSCGSMDDWSVSSLSNFDSWREWLRENLRMRRTSSGLARFDYVDGHTTPDGEPPGDYDDVPELEPGCPPPWQWIGGHLHWLNCECPTCESVPETSSESGDDESPMDISADGHFDD